MHINFERIKAKNFGSFGNDFAEVEFKDAGFVLAIGTNGCGKSTLLLDALTYALFDKPFREVSKTKVINSITQKSLMVELEMTIGKDFYLIRRGQKPNIFEIYKNEKLVDQDSTNKDYKAGFEKILGMNYKTFKQLVVLGSASHKHFMNLPALDRRAVVEELLDLQIFTKMNLLLKDKQQTIGQDINEVEQKIDTTNTKIEYVQRHLNQLRELYKKSSDDKLLKIKELQSVIDELNVAYKALIVDTKEIDQLNVQIKSLGKQSDEFMVIAGQIKSELAKIKKDVAFYDKNDSCPTCKQSLDADFKASKIESCNHNDAEYQVALKQLNQKTDKLKKTIKEYHEKQNELNEIINHKRSISDKILMYNNQIDDLHSELNKVTKHENVEEQQQSLTNLQETVNNLEYKLQDLLEEKRAFSVAGRMLKDDGIKAVVVKQYIPIINKLINKFLIALDFFCQFELDENFEECIKSRFRDNFTYNLFSEGEKFRLNIAILLAWRTLAELRNSISTNLLIMDEVLDSSLDQQGTEEIVKLLKKLTDKNNIFIISHKIDMNIDRFDKVLEFKKDGNFSKVLII